MTLRTVSSDRLVDGAKLEAIVTSGDGSLFLANDGTYTQPPVTSGVDSVNGQTGIVVLDKSDVGLSNVDNTSDISKPISTATQTALNSKVDTTTTVNGQALSSNVTLTTDNVAEGTAKYDKVVSLLAGAGIGVTGTYPNFTVTNSSPDEVVTLTAGTNVIITGTYPNFTISSTSGSSGTVTSVSVVSANGLAGSVANATTTPAITLSTSVTGILSGNGTAISAATTTGSGNVVLAISPTLVTPALGTPSALVATNATGTATGLTSGITNALKSATTTVDVSAATAPTNGQVLTATSGTTATWQTPSGGTLRRCSVYRTTNQLVVGSVEAVIGFDAERLDSDAMHDNVTNNTRITVGATGTYRITSNLYCLVPATSGSSVGIRIKKNGSTYLYDALVAPANSSATTHTFTATILDVASATTDYYEVFLLVQGYYTVTVVGGRIGNSFEVEQIAT